MFNEKYCEIEWISTYTCTYSIFMWMLHFLFLVFVIYKASPCWGKKQRRSGGGRFYYLLLLSPCPPLISVHFHFLLLHNCISSFCYLFHYWKVLLIISSSWLWGKRCSASHNNNDKFHFASYYVTEITKLKFLHRIDDTVCPE